MRPTRPSFRGSSFLLGSSTLSAALGRCTAPSRSRPRVTRGCRAR
jgi:hypothetical protein